MGRTSQLLQQWDRDVVEEEWIQLVKRRTGLAKKCRKARPHSLSTLLYLTHCLNLNRGIRLGSRQQVLRCQIDPLALQHQIRRAEKELEEKGETLWTSPRTGMLGHREHWIDASQDRIVTEIARWADESIHRLKIALRQTVTAANFSSRASLFS